jgi:microcystin-dependent protein
MDFFMGIIIPLPYFSPVGTLPCDGRELSVQSYQALFSLLGFRYGGNGTTTFCLPNLRGCEPHPGIQYVIVTDGIYPPRD